MSKLDVVPHIEKMPLSDVVHVLRSLHTARIEGIHHIMLAIENRLIKEHDKLDYRQAFEVLFFTQKIDDGEAVNPKLSALLQPTILAHWQSYTPLEQIKIVYSYWNIRQWDAFQ